MNESTCPVSLQFLRTVQVYSHIPYIAIALMLMVMMYKAFYFKRGYSGVYVIGSILLLGIPAIAISMIYHSLPTPGPWGEADSILSAVSLGYVVGILLYFWQRVGFKHSFTLDYCIPYLTAAVVFSVAYMFGLYGVATQAYHKEPLVYHMNHVQWHVMGSFSFFLSMMLLYMFLNFLYN